MKRHGSLWASITDTNNIALAHCLARRGKSHYREVKMVDANVERFVESIRDALIQKTFTTSEYRVEIKSDGRKVRTIHKLPYYPDRIVQHALINVIGPILVNVFIRDSFQSIPGRGTSDAARRVKSIIRSDKAPRYALKIDIEKYYPSVDNSIMKNAVRRHIKCGDALWLIDNIIDSTKGLPIGNYTSQHFGNLYLNRLDWWVKQDIKPEGYFRYCDDIVVLGNSTSFLLGVKNKIESFLKEIKLKIKSSWQLYDIAHNGLDFVGYVFSPNYTKLRKTISLRFKQTCKELNYADPMPENALSRLMAYRGWVKQSSSKMLWRKNLTPRLYVCFPDQLSRAV
jgi:RNA-directed DNA polymerase